MVATGPVRAQDRNASSAAPASIAALPAAQATARIQRQAHALDRRQTAVRPQHPMPGCTTRRGNRLMPNPAATAEHTLARLALE